MKRRILAAAVVLPLLLLAPRAIGPAFAQIGAAPGAPRAPLPPPPPPPGAQPQAAPAGGAPAAPGAPAAVATTGALPQLAPAPFVVQAKPAPTPQVFRCSCFGIGLGTQWVGTVQSTSYTLAGQSARQQCIAFNLNANPPSSYMPPQSPALASSNPYPVVNPYVAPGNVLNPYRGITPQPGALTAGQQLALANLCARCACN